MSDRVQLGSLVKLSTESAKDPAAVGLTRSVGLDHIDSDDLRLRRWSDIGNGADFTRVFRAGDVLFGKRRSYQRKVALADFDGVCSGDILVVRSSDPRLDGLYLAYLLASPVFIGHAISSSAGSLSPRIRPRDLERFEFDLPSLDEQHRVVEVMRAVDREIEAAQNVATTATSVLDVVRNDLLTGATTKIEDLASLNPEVVTPAAKVGSFKYLDLSSTQRASGIVDTLVRSISWSASPSRAQRRVKEGDILVATVRPNQGNFAVVSDKHDGAVASTGFCVVRPADADAARYLSHVLRSSKFIAYLAARQSGTTFPAVSPEDIATFEVSSPAMVDWQSVLVATNLEMAARSANAVVVTTRALRTSLLQELIG